MMMYGLNNVPSLVQDLVSVYLSIMLAFVVYGDTLVIVYIDDILINSSEYS